MLLQLGSIHREIDALETGMNNHLARQKARFEERARPLKDAARDVFAAIQLWAEANREQLLEPGSKTVRLATGELSWRTTPPAVTVVGSAAVIERLSEAGLDRFIRRKAEVNHKAILDEPDAVAGIEGIEINQREVFEAKPFDARIERPATTGASTNGGSK
jgi:phage host-nuclease inhibitor protein Gam